MGGLSRQGLQGVPAKPGVYAELQDDATLASVDNAHNPFGEPNLGSSIMLSKSVRRSFTWCSSQALLIIRSKH